MKPPEWPKNESKNIKSQMPNFWIRSNNIIKHPEIFELINKKTSYFHEIKFNFDTINYFLDKYPDISLEKFEKIFFTWNFNKIILLCDKNIIDLINFNKINPWEDLVKIIIEKVSISSEEFNQKVVWKIDKLAFPNLWSQDVAQSYFLDKITNLLPWTQIIFWDNPKIMETAREDFVKSDSVGFIDPLWDKILNLCILKLLKTAPDKDKLDVINKLFNGFDDVFIGWSTFNLPFSVPSKYKSLLFPKMQSNGDLKILPNWVVMNSMWFLNSAYYAEKTKASFVLWSHNIWEPLHAGKLTVISNDLKNRYNHNWMISYFWELANLILFIEWNSKNENQNMVDNFLDVSWEELKNRNDNFQKMYINVIIPFVNWVLYNYLKKMFPDKIN